jgi:hypothetical protein
MKMLSVPSDRKPDLVFADRSPIQPEKTVVTLKRSSGIRLDELSNLSIVRVDLLQERKQGIPKVVGMFLHVTLKFRPVQIDQRAPKDVATNCG